MVFDARQWNRQARTARARVTAPGQLDCFTNQEGLDQAGAATEGPRPVAAWVVSPQGPGIVV